MKHDMALPPPGTEEPQGKPSKPQGKLGEKPVLPPPKRNLDEAAVQQALQKPAPGPQVIAEKPVLTEAPPANLKVDREPLPPPAPQPIKKEKTKSGASKVKKSPLAKKKPRVMQMMDDDEVAVVSRDPRRGRQE